MCVTSGFGVDLHSRNAGTGVHLSWPVAETNFFLEGSTNIGASAHWTVVTNSSVAESDSWLSVIVPDDETKFFRLREWEVIFSGISTSSFHSPGTSVFPANSWKLSGNELQNIVGVAQGSSLITFQSFKDFELTLEWAAGSANANSGIFFRTTESPSSAVEIELQLLNDSGYPSFEPRQRMGAAYGVLSPQAVESRAVGQFNQVRLIAVGTKVEHWINGKKVLSYDTASTSFRDAALNSLLGGTTNYGKSDRGFIMLQYHNGQSRFRNIRVRSLD